MLRFIQRHRFSELQKFNDSFLGSGNAEYIENLFDRWHKDPTSVPTTWDAYFRQVSDSNDFSYVPEPRGGNVNYTPDSTSTARRMLSDHFKLRLMINQYRIRGHEKAKVDPLDLESISQIGKIQGKSKINVLEYFKAEDLEKEFYLFDEVSRGITNDKKRPVMKLKDLVAYMEKAYCGKISYEYMHINNTAERDWIRSQIENYDEFMPSNEQKIQTFERLAKEYTFSTFLQKKFNTSKRFGVEGLDSLISGLQSLVDTSAKLGLEHIVFGMAHRGRLNTLYNVFEKSAEEIMVEFQDLKNDFNEDVWGNSGDVKYHLGAVNTVKKAGNEIRLEILPNPSHLETVNPLVYGKVRAIQDVIKDTDGRKVCGVLIHGDAAVSGQGIIYESLQFADLEGYKSGGIIHIVANNQIGFTTVPKDSRSGMYCTDVAQTIQAPVFHVNADEPELVDKVIAIATEYRNKFQKDVFVDLIGYRRFGHNEQDQPKFTQPIMYEKIESTKPVFLKYAEKLISQGVVTQEFVNDKLKTHETALESSYNKSRKAEYDSKQSLAPWEAIKVPTLWGTIKSTAVPLNVLQTVGEQINSVPKDFPAHPQIKKFYEDRLSSIQNDSGIDFATAEALAFGTLLHEGYGVRVSGEDVQRATFSHRHAYLNNQKDPNGSQCIPLRNVLKENDKDKLNIYNSHLSEYGVLGFDYGYTLANPNVLVCWEAQFGDFANGAQIIIDNYITSAESKWKVPSGLVLLLPNGMDGQGPEHSSGRVERFLQLSDDDPLVYEQQMGVRLKRQMRNSNMQVVQCTTPANYFHVLRRQLRRDFRKPLIAMTSKKLLRYTPARSKLIDFAENSKFRPIIEDSLPAEQITQVLICSGQVYYDLLKKREETQKNNVAILRIEQLAPFPYEILQETLAKYTKAKFVWVQEEHQNYGPWHFIRPRILKVLSHIEKIKSENRHQLTYVGRKPSGATATGFHQLHDMEVQTYLNKAFEL